jgi:hypothetical protein
MRITLPKDGEYAQWEVALAARFPLALSEMRWPSVPLGRWDTTPAARWGIECGTGWRQIIEHVLGRLEGAIVAEPADRWDDYRIIQIKEKFGALVVYQAGQGTPEMKAAIQDAFEESRRTCDVCGAPGELAEHEIAWWSTRCPAHVAWTPWDDVT